MDYAAVIPAAGRATRLGSLPGSKEIVPVGPATSSDAPPRVAVEYLLEALKTAGVGEVYVVLREGKWDIPSHLGDGSRYGLDIAYLLMGLPFGVSYTLDQAYGFVAGKSVLLGFPDILFEPRNAFRRLMNRLEEGDAEVVLGLFPADRPHKMDMVRYDEAGRVTGIEIKPAATDLRYAWCIAAWTARFSDYLHRYVTANRDRFAGPDAPEPHIGMVMQAAMEDGMPVSAEVFPEGEVIDIGTREDLQRARVRYGG